jgi:hypothetical protein
MWTAQRLLRAALQAYNSAGDASAMRDVVLEMHAATQEAFSAYLGGQRNTPRNLGALRFSALVAQVRDQTDLFKGDERAARTLVALDGTRIQIQNRGQSPSAQQIARDATRFAELIRRLWPGLFGERCPVSLDPARPEPPPGRAAPEAPPPGAQSPVVEPPPSTSARVLRFLRALWADETGMPLQGRTLIGRLLAMAALLYAAQACKRAALSTARWPSPIRHVSLFLLLLAAGTLLWALILAWRVLWQVKLNRLLIVIGIAYALVVIISLLTSQRSLPIGQEWWLITRQSLSYVGRRVGGLAWNVVDTPRALRFAYTGSRRPRRLTGIERGDPSFLTPVPANVPVRAPTPTATPVPNTPTAVPQPSPTATLVTAAANTPSVAPTPLPPTPAILQPPNCPYPLARLTVPRVNEVVDAAIQVEGAANIENLKYYKFEFRRQDVEDEWHWAASYEEPVMEGVLGIWHAAHLPEGRYTLRLTVVNVQGNYPYPPCDVTVQVRH